MGFQLYTALLIAAYICLHPVLTLAAEQTQSAPWPSASPDTARDSLIPADLYRPTDPTSDESRPGNSREEQTDTGPITRHKHETFATQADIFTHGQEHGNIRSGDNAIEIYGSVFMTLAQSLDKYTTLTSTGSRLGFRGHKLLHDHVLTFWQIESIIDLDNVGSAEHGGNRSRLAGRDSFMGISNNFGTIVAGKHNTPYKMAVHSWDPFNHLAGDFRSTLGRVPGYVSELDHHNSLFHLRTSNSILYYPPVFGDLTLNFALGAIDESISRGSDYPIISLSAQYTLNRLNLVYAIERHNKLDIYEHMTDLDPNFTGSYYIRDSIAQLAGAMYHFGSTMLSGVVEGIQIADPVAPSGTKWSWQVGAMHKLESTWSIRASLAQSLDFMPQDGATVIALGLFNALSADTNIYFSYVQTVNRANGRYGTFFTDSIEDSPDLHTEQTVELDHFNPYTLSVGCIHQF